LVATGGIGLAVPAPVEAAGFAGFFAASFFLAGNFALESFVDDAVDTDEAAPAAAVEFAAGLSFVAATFDAADPPRAPCVA